METLGERLRRLRTVRSLSLDELAAKAGVTKAYLWRLETSSGVNPSIDIVNKLAKGLGVMASNLLGEDPPLTPSEELEIPAALYEAQNRYAIPKEDVQDLARVRFRGGQPMSPDDWMGLYLQLKRTVGKVGN